MTARATLATCARAAACVLACASGGCDGGQPGVADASDALQRHRAAFVALDRWVRRAMQGAELLGNERALAETLFARARADRSVVAAWVRYDGRAEVAVSSPTGAVLPALGGALRLRDAELGTLEVLPAATCPIVGTNAVGSKTKAGRVPSRCVFVARSAAGAGGALRVTAAFAD
jgi:hypothetical protein